MAGNTGAVTVDQDRICEAEGFDASCDLPDLTLAMCPGITGVFREFPWSAICNLQVHHSDLLSWRLVARERVPKLTDQNLMDRLEFSGLQVPTFNQGSQIGNRFWSLAEAQLSQMDYTGTIEEIDHETGKMLVSVTIFGRDTPVELDAWQVEKA